MATVCMLKIFVSSIIRDENYGLRRYTRMPMLIVGNFTYG